MEPELDFESDEVEAVKDVQKSNVSADPLAQPLVTFVEQNFSKAETARYADEQRWLRAYRNYRGVYGPDMQFTETEKSKIFVKVTKSKVIAAYGQVADVLFGTDRFPLGIEPTQLPEGVAESVHFDVQDVPQEQGPQGKPELKPGDTMQSLKERLGPVKDKLEPVMDKLKEGPGTTQTQITLHPALIAAKNMEKKIHDQLEESHATKHLRKTAFEMVLFGTGIMKGPFALDKEYPSWEEDGTYKPVLKTIPAVSSVSIWNFYPDPDADNMEETEFTVERHKLGRSQLRKLKSRPHFRKNAIDHALELGESYHEKWWESQMEEDGNTYGTNRFEVLEFWGYVDTDLLKDMDVKLGALADEEQVSVNIWICNGQLLRCVMNPFTPSYIPYYATPYEVNPYSFFGVGIAENMDDTQTMMNGFMRMAIDNAALSGNLIIEIDETHLVPGQDMRVFPGKVFRRQGGAPGHAIFGTKYPNVSNENMQMFDKARQLADESTGLPSFSHGQTGITGVGRTSSGISMLMSAASGSIRTVVKNIDDYLLAPLGKALFHFNMQFDYDPEIKGDLEVKARGTESLMANEVRSQRLMQFLSIVQNPMLAPFAKMDYIIREIAKSMDLDPDKVTNSLADAAIQATILQKFQQTMAPPEQGGQPGAPGVPAPSDTQGSGNGNIGIGQSPVPQEQGFSGAPQ
jgi:hypothetical protein